MKGLMTIIRWVGLPLLIVGLFFGSWLGINSNLERPVYYNVKEVCEGTECDTYEEALAYEDGLCKLIGEEYIKHKDSCIVFEPYQDCLESNNHLYCLQEFKDRFPDYSEDATISYYDRGPLIMAKVNIVNYIHKLEDTYSNSEKHNNDLIEEMRKVNTENQELISRLEKYYPSKLYCEGEGTLIFNYTEVENVVLKSYKVNNFIEYLANYELNYYAVCKENKENIQYYFNRKENGYNQVWYASNQDESDNCRACTDGYSVINDACKTGVVKDEEEVISNRQINITLNKGELKIVELNQSLKDSTKKELSKYLIDNGCSVNNLIESVGGGYGIIVNWTG